jgi:hypothetical protein
VGGLGRQVQAGGSGIAIGALTAIFAASICTAKGKQNAEVKILLHCKGKSECRRQNAEVEILVEAGFTSAF